tara:strand:- start:1158 stop:2795 length:1638 start_codon:yes stop_codon:yes gene_type:complete
MAEEDNIIKALKLAQSRNPDSRVTNKMLEEALQEISETNVNQTGLMGLLGGIGKAANKSGVGSLLGGMGDMPKEGEVKTTRIEKLDIPLISGISEDRNILNALMNDIDGKVDEETKQFYYNTIIPRLFQEAQTDSEKRQIKMLAEELNVSLFALGGRAGFNKGSLSFSKRIRDEYEANVKEGYEGSIEDYIIEFYGEEYLDSTYAKGGRAGYQTGGVTESRVLPPEFIEAAQKTFLTDLSRQSGIPSITTAVQQQPGETAEQFANRQAQAQQFQITKAGMAELAPQVAAQDTLQTAARTQAVDPATGLGSFQPFLTKAGTAADAATGLTGAGAGTGTGTIAEYTSPFQQQVIDTTLAEFDKQRQAQQNQLAARTLGVPGAFGGGREGVQRAEFQAASDLNRSRLLADLQQRGFESAAQRRQQDLANQMGIAGLQSNLGARTQDLARAQISSLGTLGAQEQAQQQAILDAQRQAAAMAVQDPRDRLARFGQGITGLTPGAGTVQIAPTAAEQASGASPLMTALGLGLAGADIYGRIFKPQNVLKIR